MLLAVLILGAGCGTGDELQQTLLSPSSSSVLSGTVRRSDGTPAPRTLMFVYEGSTGMQTQGISGDDGSFHLQIPPGVYDVGFDLENDPQTATCLFGPIDLGQDVSRDFVLAQAGEHPPRSIFGIVYLRAGEPAAGIRLCTRAVSTLMGDVLTDRETITDARGAFQITLDTEHEVALDLEVYDTTGGLDEFVSLPKRSKPFCVEITTNEVPVEDAYRIDEVPDVGNSSEFGASSSEVFSFRSLGPDRCILEKGRVPATSYKYRWHDLLRESSLPHEFKRLLTNSSDAYIIVGANGSYWYKYSVEVKVNNGDRLPKFWFTDEAGDTYSLLCLTESSHKVSYNSPQPDIVKIEIKL